MALPHPLRDALLWSMNLSRDLYLPTIVPFLVGCILQTFPVHKDQHMGEEKGE